MKLNLTVFVFVIGMLAFMGCSHANAAPTKKQTTEVCFSQMVITTPVILATENMEVLQTFEVSEAIHLFKPIVILELDQPLLFAEDKYVTQVTEADFYTTTHLRGELYIRTDHKKNYSWLKNDIINSIKIRADNYQLSKA